MLKKTLAVAALACAVLPALAQEATLRKNLAERLPPQFPKIDEVRKTPIEGLYEVRFGTQIFYSDAEGNHLIQGELLDTRTRRNLTEERIAKLTAIDFASLPLKDAVVWKNGTGARKIAVFSDPNCGYCKRLERDLQSVKDVTVYTFLYPLLGPDSQAKARDIWCAKDRTQAWLDWMRNDKAPPKTTAPQCSTPLERNVELGRKHQVNGTPAIVFEDGTRVPGAISAEQLEQRLAALAPRR